MIDRNRRKEVLSGLMEGTKKLITRLREDVDELSTKGKLRLEIISLKNRRARVFRELGMRTYVLIKNRRYAIPEVKGILEEIDRLDKEIKEQVKALEDFVAGAEIKAKSRSVKAAGKTSGRGKPSRK